MICQARLPDILCLCAGLKYEAFSYPLIVFIFLLDAVVVFIMYTGIESWVPDEEYVELDE